MSSQQGSALSTWMRAPARAAHWDERPQNKGSEEAEAALLDDQHTSSQKRKEGKN